ncbi:putative cysteine protease YraA [mine drainage metagenome]|uniref:Putative cysteine protease YraA n=1 Tax=mine drainage metagenome TaxID=410659 RepID=A0A1J5Q0K7_9ZZZZ
MMKKAILLTANDFDEMEVFFPMFRLIEEGWQVDVAAPVLGEMHSETGYPLDPDLTIDQVDPDDYELLLLPGGSPDGAPAAVRDSIKAQAIVRSFFNRNKPVASICHGPWTLAAADVIRGRRLTSYWHDGVRGDIKEAGGIWEDQAVVVDGNLITSRYQLDLPDFMREVIKLVTDVPDTH